MVKSKNAKAEALKFPKNVSNKVILDKCADVWKTRNVNADGSLKPNRWAPIYCVRGESESLSVRLVGKKLILSGEIAERLAPTPKITW